MPTISITTALHAGDGGELVLVELQGKLESSGSGDLRGQHLGDLSLTPGGPVLVIGNQRLAGKTVTLKKPLAVLDTRLAEGAIRIIQVVTQKYLFDARPSTIFPNKLA